jgi:hypothetical protein
MNNTWNYITECKSCNKRHINTSYIKTIQWSIFDESLRPIKDRGFVYNYCVSVECANKITKQELISYDNINKK